MNVVKYIRADISEGVESVEVARDLVRQYPDTLELLELEQKAGDIRPTPFVLYSYLNFHEYTMQKREGIELPKLKCPKTGVIGICDNDYYQSNITNKNNLESLMSNVELFHKIFGHPVGEELRMLTESEVAFRYVLLREELKEFSEAKSIEDQFDALLDLMYILFGTFVQAGYNGELVERGFLEVQKSNMTKLGADGKPMYHENGKIKKGENYREPQLSSLIDEYLSKKTA